MKFLNSFVLKHDSFNTCNVTEGQVKAKSLVLWSNPSESSPLLVTKIEEIDRKDAYMQMLLHLNGDFDDDLLFDSI